MSDEESSGDDTIRFMAIFCSVGIAIFSFIYVIHWRRAKENNSDGGIAIPLSRSNVTHSSEEEEEDGTSREDGDDDESSSSGAAPPRKFTHAWEPRERQPGDPIYDKWMVGGTASLGIFLWIGATIVLIFSLIQRSEFNDASTNDFKSLGPIACRIDSSLTYNYRDERVNKLNSLCVEEWEYRVQVVEEEVILEDEETVFVSAPISAESCWGTCEACVSQNRLFGPDYYAGLDPLRPGYYITNETFVECFAPTVPVESLSDFYNCGRQLEENGTCFVLEDLTEALEEEMESVRIGLTATYTSYGVGALLLGVVACFMHRNKRERLSVLGNQEGTRNDVDYEGESLEKEDKGDNDENGRSLESEGTFSDSKEVGSNDTKVANADG